MAKRNPQNDFEYWEKINTLESEVEMIENSLLTNRNPFERKKQQSLLYEKRKQLTKAKTKYEKFIQHNNT